MPSISLAVSLRGQLLSGTRSVVPAFSPIDLFSLNEPGVWYDPSDLSTLFQDTAGTTPVTTPGNTVALMLDKSKALTLGTELVTNGTFDTNVTGWSGLNTGTVAWSSGRALVTSNGFYDGLTQTLTSVVGRFYSVTANIELGTAATVRLYLQNTVGPAVSAITTTAGVKTITFIGQATTTGIMIRADSIASTGTFFVDNVTVKELPGFHATQATAASRPTYGVVPTGGRRNLLTWSEDLTNAAWSAEAGAATFTANTSGTLDRITYTGTFGGARQSLVLNTGTTYTVSFDCRRISGSNPLAIQVASSNATYASFNPDSTLTRYALTFTATVSSLAVIIAQDRIGGAGLGSVEIGNIQLELGSTATAYQRTTTQFDVTEAGVQSLSYLSFDGVDDGMVTGTITPGIDRAQVFAGVRKLSNAAAGMFAELSADYNANAGSFYITAPENTGGAGNYGASSRGSVASAANQTAKSAVLLAPISSVLTVTNDIAGDLSAIRVNGAASGTNGTGDKGTGNFGNYPLYIGRRGGTTLPFNGLVFGIITRFGANLDTTAITNTETWVAGKTGVTL